MPDVDDLYRQGVDLEGLPAEPMAPEPPDEAGHLRPAADLAAELADPTRRPEEPVTAPPPLWRYAADGLEIAPRELAILVGGTGGGKTAMACQIALATARAGAPVVYVLTEGAPEDVIARMAAVVAAEGLVYPGSKIREMRANLAATEPLSWAGIARRRWLDPEWGARGAKARALHALEDLGDLPLWVVRGADLAKERDENAALRKIAEYVAAKHERPALVVIDYLQRWIPGDVGNRREAVGAASDAARALAEAGHAVLVLSSTARENYKVLTLEHVMNAPAEDLVGLGKESGELEYDASHVLVVALERTRINEERTDPRLGLLRRVKARYAPPDPRGATRRPLWFWGRLGLWAAALSEDVKARALEEGGASKGNGKSRGQDKAKTELVPL